MDAAVSAISATNSAAARPPWSRPPRPPGAPPPGGGGAGRGDGRDKGGGGGPAGAPPAAPADRQRRDPRDAGHQLEEDLDRGERPELQAALTFEGHGGEQRAEAERR